jgi:hypothetical protein
MSADRLPQVALDLLSGADGRYSPWATASAVAMYAINAGYTEDQFVELVTASDFAYLFATEDKGRDRSNRLTSRLSKVWGKAEDAWNPPLREAIDVRERLAALSQRIADYPWSGRTAGTDQAVAVALITWAHEIGVWTLDAGCRELSLRAMVAQRTAARALARLVDKGLIERAGATARKDDHAQRWVINLGWGAFGQDDPHKPLPPTEEIMWATLAESHPVFLPSGLGRTAGRIWLDLAEHPGEGATAAQIADRAAIPLRSVNRVLKDKLVPNCLVVVSESRPSKGRPSVAYRLNLDGPLLDEIAESFGLLDWQERAAERYERERGGYRDVLRQREQRERESHEAEWKPAEEGWWLPDPFAPGGLAG